MVAQAAARYGLADAVTIHGEVERIVALSAMRSSAVLLLLLNTAGDLDHIEVGNPGSKILEYAGARRPILAVGSQGNAVEKIVNESGLGIYAYDEASCARAIQRLYADFAAGKLEPAVNGQWRPTSPRELAGGFAALLDVAIRSR